MTDNQAHAKRVGLPRGTVPIGGQGALLLMLRQLAAVDGRVDLWI